MRVTLEHIGRRFNREWIFRNIDYTFDQGGSYAVLGHNGSGKSTFLQIMAGSLSSSEGRIRYYLNDQLLEEEQVFQYLSISAPYLELIEEFTLTELIDFHFHFKPYKEGLNRESLIEILDFQRSRHKMLKHFSSGMKQRTKLALACCSDTPILLLDEPTANLDSQGINWYKQLIRQFTSDRLVIVCSNQEYEYDFCRAALQITDYK